MDNLANSIRERMLHDRSCGAAKSLAEYARLFGEDAIVTRAYGDVFGADVAFPASAQDSIAHYRILKELGSGGQGVVYLAEDTRLNRKVALKILTGLGRGSEDSVHRLRREAEVASKLHHPGICGVHDAGVAKGTPYIAMQYVEGTTLSEWVSAAKSKATGAKPASPEQSAKTVTTKQEITEILRVFEKAAQALHAAHEAGIIHRDIKPGNIMVTSAGQPVILDFGLARSDDMDFLTLTKTGDVFGTPLYMSPEQLSGQRIRLDRRSDVYSLGVTLFECLTLRRAFDAPTREGVFQAVMTKNPPDPRRINPSISKDLKVILETALEKDRDRRYATADALAHDLQALLEGRPIQARPVGPVGRFVRWSKREPSKAALLGVILVALPVIATLVTSHLKDQPHVEAARLAKIEQDKDVILSEASYELSEGSARKAIALYTQALEMEGSSPEAAGGLVLVQLKLQRPSVALELLDLHHQLLGDGTASQVLRADALRALGRTDEAQELMRTAPEAQSAFEHRLLAQKELQNCQTTVDRPTFERALRHVTTAILLSPAPRLSLYTLRAHAAGHAKNRDAAVETVAALRKRWPESGAAMYWCAWALSQSGDPTVLDASIAAGRDAVRLTPDSAANHGIIGYALAVSGRDDEAIAAYREAIRLRPDYAEVHRKLGLVHQKNGRYDEAIAAYREAIRLKPDYAETHRFLGVSLKEKGRIEESIAAFHEAIRLKPDYAEAIHDLGAALGSKGLSDEAIAAFREAIRLKPDHFLAHRNLGGALSEKGLLDEAAAECREAIRLKPDDAEAHNRLAVALEKNGLTNGAIAAYREAIRLKPDLADAYHNLGVLLATEGFIDEAIAAWREAIRLTPGSAETHYSLGATLLSRGDGREALPELRLGHEIGSRQPGWRLPSAQLIEGAQQRADEEQELGAQLAEYVAAGTQPESANELVALARVAIQQNRPALAARWFQSAFEASPDFASAIDAGHRRLAARAAILASIVGTDSAPVLDATARAAWRVQALAWLEADLAGIKKASEAKGVSARGVRIALVPLTRSPDFASVRAPDAIARLPDPERARWTKLWAEIDAMLASLDAKPESR